jgi:hypothetical protein
METSRGDRRLPAPAQTPQMAGLRSISRSDLFDLNEKELLQVLNLEPFPIDQVCVPDRKRL